MAEVPEHARVDPELAFRIDDVVLLTSRGLWLTGVELTGRIEMDMCLDVAGHHVRVTGTESFLPLKSDREGLPVGVQVVGADLGQLVAGIGTVVGICRPS